MPFNSISEWKDPRSSVPLEFLPGPSCQENNGCFEKNCDPLNGSCTEYTCDSTTNTCMNYDIFESTLENCPSCETNNDCSGGTGDECFEGLCRNCAMQSYYAASRNAIYITEWIPGCAPDAGQSNNDKVFRFRRWW